MPNFLTLTSPKFNECFSSILLFTKFSKNLIFKACVSDFYRTNPIARASLTMNELSKRSGAACQTIAAE